MHSVHGLTGQKQWRRWAQATEDVGGGPLKAAVMECAMPALLLSLVRIVDPTRFAAYGAGLVGTTERAGGTYLFRGWVHQVLGQGGQPGERCVLVAYENLSGPARYRDDPAVLASKTLRPGAAQVAQPVFLDRRADIPAQEITDHALVIAMGGPCPAPAWRRWVDRAPGTRLATGLVRWRADGDRHVDGQRLAIWRQALSQDPLEAFLMGAPMGVTLCQALVDNPSTAR